MTIDKDVELVARAMFVGRNEGTCYDPWEEQDPYTRSRYEDDAKAALAALGDRVLPSGGVTMTEYGLNPSSATVVTGMVMIGHNAWAMRHGTHQRRRTSWIGEGPNNEWARYVTAWEDRVKSDD